MEDRITELSQEDKDWLRRAEEHILASVRARYGGITIDRSLTDLAQLQRLIDDRAITKENVLEAQCIGVVLGNVFAHNTNMRWQRVANQYGDMISLHDEGIQFTLYPLTMVSERLDDGRAIDLIALNEDLVQSLHLKENAR